MLAFGLTVLMPSPSSRQPFFVIDKLKFYLNKAASVLLGELRVGLEFF